MPEILQEHNIDKVKLYWKLDRNKYGDLCINLVDKKDCIVYMVFEIIIAKDYIKFNAIVNISDIDHGKYEIDEEVTSIIDCCINENMYCSFIDKIHWKKENMYCSFIDKIHWKKENNK